MDNKYYGNNRTRSFKNAIIILILFLSISSILSINLFGQVKFLTGKWWKVQRVIDILSLTKTQISKLEKIHSDGHKRLWDLRATFHKERLEFEEMVQEKKLNLVKLEAQVDKVLEALRIMQKEEIMIGLRLLNVLNPAQREIVKKQEIKMRKK